jgi:hypothetical protein
LAGYPVGGAGGGAPPAWRTRANKWLQIARFCAVSIATSRPSTGVFVMMDTIVLLIVIFPIFAVVVGALATAKNRSFFGWFLLSFLITPIFARWR